MSHTVHPRKGCPGQKADINNDLAAELTNTPEPRHLHRLIPVVASERTGPNLPQLAPASTEQPEFDAMRITPSMWSVIWDSPELGEDPAIGSSRICVTRTVMT